MHPKLICALPFLYAASISAAATVEMGWSRQWNDPFRWNGGEIEIRVDLLPGESISAFGGDLACGGGCVTWIVHDWTLEFPGWTVLAYEGTLETNEPMSLRGDPGQTGQLINGPANQLVLTTFRVDFGGPVSGFETALTMEWVRNPWNGFYDGKSQRLTWDSRYHMSYSGYIAYGHFGNPGWGTSWAKGHQPTHNPLLTITGVPEPATAGLLFCGIARIVMRRRESHTQKGHVLENAS
jgi:hypothetical protein